MVTIDVGEGRAVKGPLISNGFELSTDSKRLGWLKPTDPSRPIQELRDQYRQDGYLWLKGILDRDAVLDFRRRYFERMQETGMLKAGSDPVDGIFSGESWDREAVRKGLMEVVRWARYEAFCMMEPILSFYETFIEAPVYLHKRKIIRHNFPGESSCTGAHYDLVYLRGGTDKLFTSWIPIGDVSVEMGGLVYLEGSDADGRRIEEELGVKNLESLTHEEKVKAHHDSMLKGWLSKDLPALAEKYDRRWLMADYEAGDMVVHSPYMVHAATQNTDEQGRFRLSTDIRYQSVREEIDIRWANHWSLDDML